MGRGPDESDDDKEADIGNAIESENGEEADEESEEDAEESSSDDNDSHGEVSQSADSDVTGQMEAHVAHALGQAVIEGEAEAHMAKLSSGKTETVKDTLTSSRKDASLAAADYGIAMGPNSETTTNLHTVQEIVGEIDLDGKQPSSYLQNDDSTGEADDHDHQEFAELHSEAHIEVLENNSLHEEPRASFQSLGDEIGHHSEDVTAIPVTLQIGGHRKFLYCGT